jgi:hypothetical protein
MDLRAKREAYHEAKMNSHLGWNSSATEKNQGMDISMPEAIRSSDSSSIDAASFSDWRTSAGGRDTPLLPLPTGRLWL